MTGPAHSRGIFTRDAESYLLAGSPVTVERLAPGVWTATSRTYRTVFFEGDTSVTAVNTFGTPAAAKALRDAIQSTVPGKPLAGLISTLDHLDHTGYGAELGVTGECVGHALTERVITSRNASGQLPITRRISGHGAKVDIDGVAVSLIYAGPSVGTGNLAVELPGGVLFVVGPQGNARYGIFPDYHFRHVAGVWRRLADRDIEIVVPGRYGLLDVAGLHHAADYVDALAASCQAAFAQGVPAWDVETVGQFVGGQLRAEFEDLDGFNSQIAMAAARVVDHYRMGGWGLEDTAEPDRLLEYAPSDAGPS
jgi:hypothetical protein